MIFVFPFHAGDYGQAEGNLRWTAKLGCARNHSIILMPAKALPEFPSVMEAALLAFGIVGVLPDAEGIVGHPEGPNSAMRQAIWHMQTSNLGPWTYWEPDCIPLTADAFDVWEREYRAFGKPFMGEFRPGNGVTPDYLSGNMVLPKDGLMLAPMLARRGLSKDGVELAFDIVAASQTLPQAHLTKLLHQVPKNEDGSGATFPDKASLSIIRQGAVLFHPCKDGSLIARLSEKSSACVSGLNVSPSRDEQELGAERGLTSSALPPEGSTPSAEAELRARVWQLESLIEELKKSQIDAASRFLETKMLTRKKNAKKTKKRRSAIEQARINVRMAKVRAARLAKA